MIVKRMVEERARHDAQLGIYQPDAGANEDTNQPTPKAMS